MRGPLGNWQTYRDGGPFHHVTMSSCTITTPIVVSFLECDRKAFLLLFGEEKGIPHEYTRILERLRTINHTKQISTLIEQGKVVKPCNEGSPEEKGCFFTDVKIRAGNLEAYCDIVESPLPDRPEHRPIIITGTYRISAEQRLELLFAGHVLEKASNSNIQSGSIIDRGGRIHKLKLANSLKTLNPILNSLNSWITVPPAEPPPVILHKGCSYCQFFDSCKSIAERTDDLSLLDRMTPKLIKRYHDKGIFTLRQLSFLFRPRRSRKRKRKPKEIYKPELQALAIRTGKIYLQGVPELARHQTELYLDIEGLPDQGFHYLIGLLVRDGQSISYRNFWATTPQDEERIYRQFLEAVREHPEAPIYHYGSYESKALRQLAGRYEIGIEPVKKRLVNLNTHIFGRMYFPVKSNRLKEIGAFIGASWTSPDASGLQSIVWRYLWEEMQQDGYKDLLIQYNREDCQAIQLLTDEIRKIGDTADSQPNIDYVEHPKRQATDVGNEVHSQFQAILRSAHAGYDSKKISFQDNPPGEKRKPGAQKGHPGYHRFPPEAQEVTWWPPRRICPKCKSELSFSDRLVERTVTDLIFTENGCSRKIIRFKGHKGYCSKCHRHYSPESLHSCPAFGHGFQSWIIYQRLYLRLPYESIVQSLEEQFREKISSGVITQIIRRLAEFYSETENLLLQRILASPFIHVDETKVNVQGAECYVWVFTDGQRVVLRMTETREAILVAELLKEYKGVLVSDFYGGYDSIGCQQQKCLVHLIRDLNDDLWKSPFDGEYQEFILEVRALIVPIIETVHRYGLSQAHLGCFKAQVESFYERAILGKTYHSETALKYQKRFKRYRMSLFTFLDHEGIPWNNNMAERALRHLVVQENISKTFYKSVFPQHSLLLGIMQTCRFRQISFLRFLISGEKDLDVFGDNESVAKEG